MNQIELLVDSILVRRLYEGSFNKGSTSQYYDKIRQYLDEDIVKKQIKNTIESDELWIKVNLGNERGFETGCVNHPVTIKAVIDYILNDLNFKGPIRICEADSFYKGPAFFTPKEERASFFNHAMSKEEREAIVKRIEAKDPNQDAYEFGFNLALELSGINDLIQYYKAAKANVQILNVSKEPVMSLEEVGRLVENVEHLLGSERIPIPEVRNEIVNNIPKPLKEKKLGLISLAVAKTHNSPEIWATATIKNVAMGLLPQVRKGFMHKDLAKAIVYHQMIWQMGCGNRVFGIVAGPYGMDGEGPVWGKLANFPYIIAGSDYLKIDCITAMIMFGKVDLIPQIKQFIYADGKIGLIPSKAILEKLESYMLNYEPRKYVNIS